MISNSTQGAAVKKIDEFNAADRIELKLLENHTYFLSGDIDDSNVGECIKWITYENLDQKPKTLTLYVNSQGGDLYQAFALIDVMRFTEHPIRTIGIGNIMSAAFLIFASGTKGERYLAANTGVMCHQYSDDHTGKHHDLKATMKEGEHCNDRMLSILKAATGLPPSRLKTKLLSATDVYLTAQEAIDLGIADHLL